MFKITFKKFICLSLVATMGTIPASATLYDYQFQTAEPGVSIFYNSTSTDKDYIANSNNIILGIDGVASNTSLVTVSPLSSIDLPVGAYPDAWGMATDISIAQNSVFVNELGPTSQTVGIYTPIYQPFAVDSGALPVNSLLSIYSSYASNALINYTLNSGLTTAITTDGALALLSIPSVNINAYMYEGTSQANMAKGVGHFDCTPLWGGNIAIAGHNTSKTTGFATLKNVSIGDSVSYTTSFGTRTYEISAIDTVDTSDVSGLLQDGTNKITMYTCKAGQPEVKLKVTATLVS